MGSARAVRFALRCVLMAVATALALVGVAGVASAHVTLENSTPADGSPANVAPAEVALVFSAAPLAVTSVTVTAPDGSNVASGAPTRDGPRVSQALGPLTVTGQYTASYVVVSDDSDEVTGTISFDYTAAAEGGPAPAVTTEAPATVVTAVSSGDTDDDDEGRDVGGVVIGAVIVLAVLGALFFLVRRLRRRS